MWLSMVPIVLLSILSFIVAPTAEPTPTIFAPDVISGPADDASPAFDPDGKTVYFMRGTDDGSTLMESHLVNGHWSMPQKAPFSGQWRDLDPAMAPDGSFLLFVSNRPAQTGDQPIDAVNAGKRRPGQGMNIWRVDREGSSWSLPVRLPDTVNACSMTFAPSIAADGSIYFVGCDRSDGSLQLLRSTYQHGGYQPAYKVALGDPGARIRDPAIAPDRSFMVFSIKHDAQQPYRLAIAFHNERGWSAPLDLGDTVNAGTHSMGAQLGCDKRTLYFYSDRRLSPSDPHSTAEWNNGSDNIWRVSLAPWLTAHDGTGPKPSLACTTG
jgi:hypothetical protein